MDRILRILKLKIADTEDYTGMAYLNIIYADTRILDQVIVSLKFCILLVQPDISSKNSDGKCMQKA